MWLSYDVGRASLVNSVRRLVRDSVYVCGCVRVGVCVCALEDTRQFLEVENPLYWGVSVCFLP